MDEAVAHQQPLNPAELKQAQTETFDNFKYVTMVYGFHGKESDFTDTKAKYKISDEERQYIGLKTDAAGQVTDYMNGAKIVGYLDDKTGARAIAVQGTDGENHHRHRRRGHDDR